MTKEQFVAKWRHEIDGWILDAAIEARRGADLSMFLRGMRAKVEAKLVAMYCDFQTTAPPANGQPGSDIRR